MRKIIVLIALILNAVILFYSCKKDEKEQPEFDTVTSQDNALAEGIYNDVNTIANEAIDNGSSGLSTYRVGVNENSILSTCATVNLTPDTSGHGGTISVNFGTQNCRCNDFRFRRGTINIQYTGAYRDSGTQINITFDNYYVGFDTTRMFKVGGTKSVRNNGHNAAGNLNYTININGLLTNSAGANMTWTSTRNREWVAGENTLLNWLDDEYVITGNASATNFEGTSYTAAITNGLRIALVCPYIKQGSFDLTPAGKPVRTFDFGTGACDDQATVTVNGTTFPITLR